MANAYKRINVNVRKVTMDCTANFVSTHINIFIYKFFYLIIIHNFLKFLAKCVIPCKNGGRCIGTNICRCPSGLLGKHCEIERIQRSTCRRPCKHGVCTANKICKCDRGFYGRHCNASMWRNFQWEFRLQQLLIQLFLFTGIKKHRKIHR